MARFTQAAVEFILGVAACALGPLGAVAVTTVDIYKFCAENRLMIIAAGKAWYHVARVRGVLMVHTPTLHALLEATVWRSSWEALKSVPGLLINSSTAMPASIADEAAGRLAGTIVGKLSIADFKSKLGILKVVLQLLLAIILKAAPVAGKAVAAKLSQADAAVIKDLIDAARRIGVSVSQNEGPKIVAELKRHGAMIKPLLETAVQSIKAVEEAAKTAEGTSAAGGAQK